MDRASALTENFVASLRDNDAENSDFLNAVREIAHDVLAVEKNHPDWAAARVLHRLAEPDRIVTFRVTWEDDTGAVQINRGWRVQASNAIGPYKGGLRFHPEVTLDTLRFLAFEQCFKNALTGLALGGAKGGSDFNPKGRSPREVMRFCQAFMRMLAPFVGPDRDVPAGDINVGTREIGWLFGAWTAHANIYGGAFTGKGESYGGSEIRKEATGYGVIYFVEAMLRRQGENLEGKRVAISGLGNVARFAAEKAIDTGAKVLTLSDTSGVVYAPDGMSRDALDWVLERKDAGEDLSGAPQHLGLEFRDDFSPWVTGPDIALPCATQNEVGEEDARALIDGGARYLAEGANMPLTPTAASAIAASEILRAPGKAANAGGVAVSGLEMSQNNSGRFCTRDEVDQALCEIVTDLHDRVAEEGTVDGKHIDYVRGANVAAYRRLAAAITAQGVN